MLVLTGCIYAICDRTNTFHTRAYAAVGLKKFCRGNLHRHQQKSQTILYWQTGSRFNSKNVLIYAS